MRRMYSEKQIVNAVEQVSKQDGIKIFENIVDEDGHARFIGGTLTIEPFNSREVKYAHWSLSGSHLIIVICYSVESGQVITSGQVLANLNDQLPKWIQDKLYPIFSDIVAMTTADYRGDDYSSQTSSCYLQKTSSNNIRIMVGGLTLNKDRTVRIAYDLLIDNE